MSADERVFSVLISHSDKHIDPIVLIAVYGPSTSAQRNPFYCSLTTFLASTPHNHSTILFGKFNGNFHHHATWRHYLEQHFSNAITAHNSAPLATFNNGRLKTYIDFIFSPHNLTTNAPKVIFLDPSRTNHGLLTVSLRLQRLYGPDAWCFNTMFLTLDSFADQPNLLLDSACTSLQAVDSPGSQWYTLDQTIKNFIMTYTKQHA